MLSLNPLKTILNIISAKKTKNKVIRKFYAVALILMILAVIVAIVGNIVFPSDINPKENSIALITCFSLVGMAYVLFAVGDAIVADAEKKRKEELITEQEKKVAENPNEPKLAWDLARIKLESYLDRNISQVRSIFYLSVTAMIVGFGLIIYGAMMAYQKKENFDASIMVSISGIIVNFTGATFLVLYKSIMAQAKDYVNVLERINAVGMSVQIIETIDDTHIKLREETKAELSKKLIDLYAEKK